MQRHTSTFKRCTLGILSLLMALQPTAGQAQAIGQALRDADKPQPHVLPIATAPDMLPLPYVSAAWRARAKAHVEVVQHSFCKLFLIGRRAKRATLRGPGTGFHWRSRCPIQASMQKESSP